MCAEESHWVLSVRWANATMMTSGEGSVAECCEYGPKDEGKERLVEWFEENIEE